LPSLNGWTQSSGFGAVHGAPAPGAAQAPAARRVLACAVRGRPHGSAAPRLLKMLSRLLDGARVDPRLSMTLDEAANQPPGRPLSWLDDAETRLDTRGHVDIRQGSSSGPSQEETANGRADHQRARFRLLAVLGGSSVPGRTVPRPGQRITVRAESSPAHSGGCPTPELTHQLSRQVAHCVHERM
jgi:hypothetical protein